MNRAEAAALLQMKQREIEAVGTIDGHDLIVTHDGVRYVVADGELMVLDRPMAHSETITVGHRPDFRPPVEKLGLPVYVPEGEAEDVEQPAEAPEPAADDLDSMNVAALKDRAAELGLTKSGTRDELIARISEHLSQPPQSDAADVDDGGGDDEAD